MTSCAKGGGGRSPKSEFCKILHFAEWVDFDYWWSFSGGGSVFNGAYPV